MANIEAFSRILIDRQLEDARWSLTDGASVRYEYHLPDGTQADYVLCDRHGRALAVLEAKKFSINPADAAAQALAYAKQLKVPFVFLANGREILFWEYDREAHPRAVKTVFSQADLERRAAMREVRRDLLATPVDRRIVERDYQLACIDALSREITQGRRKLLVEMATGTGKTRTAAALIKRLFEAGAATRALFLVDRIQLALQTEEAFAEHLPDLPCYVLRTGRRFQDEKRITITTLQSMVNLYRDYSSGYFDLVISDECHRSIYGQWSGVLKHFDGIQIGLTATPCISGEDAVTADAEDRAFVRDTLRFFELERPTFSYKLKDAIREGHLVPYQIYKAQTVKTAAEGGFPVKRAELDWSSLSAEDRQALEEHFGDSDELIVDPSALERRFTIPERNRAIVREYRKVMDEGYFDARSGHVRKPLLGKTIVFAVTKRHAETLARMFDEVFADQKPDPAIRYADYVVSGFGADDTVDAAAKIRRFKRETFPKILVSVNMLDTGFDCPEVTNLVFARFTRSVILYQQMRGRGTRKAPGKAVFTLFDFVGVSDFHGDDDGYAQGGAVTTREPTPAPNPPRRLLALDVYDHIDPNTRGWLTVDENGNLVRPEAAVQRATELGLRFEAWLLRQSGLNAEQERLLRMISEQLKSNPPADGERADAFTADHFSLPPFSLVGGLRHAERTFGGVERLLQLIGSLNAAMVADDGASPNRAESGSHPAAPGTD